MSYASNGIWILGVLILAMASGCECREGYMLSKVPPFSAYSGQDVTLTRQALLIEDVDRWHNHYYRICYLNDWDAKKDAAGASGGHHSLLQPGVDYTERRVVLQPGTRAYVRYTGLGYDRQTIFEGFSSEAVLGTAVLIKPGVAGWPPDMTVIFNDWSKEFMVDIDKKQFKGTIRPAPWEPLDTPAERRIAWPDEALRVRGDQ